MKVIDEAIASGARQSACCELLGPSPRTILRWRAGKQDGRRGPHHLGGNTLSEAERRVVLTTINSAPYQGLSPHQIVPKLADRGIYLSSEAPMYRLIREEKTPRRNQLRRIKSAQNPRILPRVPISYGAGISRI